MPLLDVLAKCTRAQQQSIEATNRNWCIQVKSVTDSVYTVQSLGWRAGAAGGELCAPGMCSVTKWPMQLLCAPPDDDHYDCLMFTGRSKNTNSATA